MAVLPPGEGEDLSLGDGIPWSNSGFIDEGSGYDLRSGRMSRTVSDFTVTGSVGALPLVQRRAVYTEANEGGVYTQWVMTAYGYRASSVYVWLPSGVRIYFDVATSDGVTTHKNRGGSDRVTKNASGVITDYWSGDGTHVVFNTSGKPTTIYDRHGLATTLSYGSNGISQATDASGRWISYSYYTVPGTSSVKLRQATSSDGQWARYDWAYSNLRYYLTGVTYSDGTSASYTHTVKRVPEVYRDTRSSARMQEVRFAFRGTMITGGTSGPAVALWYENNVANTATVSERDPAPNDRLGQRDVIPYVAWRVNRGRRYEFRGEFLDAIVDEFGSPGVTWFDYGSGAYLSSITDPLNRITTFEREPAIGRINKINLPDGTYRQHTFTSTVHPYFIATSRDELGRVTTYDRFSNGTLGNITYPDGTTEGWAYNSFNQPTIHRFRNGAHEWFDYDGQGRLLRHWLPSFGGATDKISYTYYADGHAWEDRVQTETDARGNVTTYEYDCAFSGGVQGTTPCTGRGLVTKATNHDGTYLSFTYNKFGVKVWEENELRQRTSYTYDDYQRVLTETDPLGRVTTYDYTMLNPLTHTRDKPAFITLPSGKKEAFIYDSEFRTASHTLGYGSADASTTSYGFDEVGNQTSVTDPMGRVTTFAYNTRDRKTHQYAPLSRTTQWEYDAVGNVTKVINPDATFTRKEYDSMNRVKDAWDERNQHTGTTYHPSGQVNVVTDPRGNTYTHGYDASNRPTSRTYPGGSVESWTYDPAGNKVTETTRSGQVLRIYYDNRNREYWRAWDNNAAPSVWTGFDAASRVTSKSNWHGWLTYTFDAAGQVTAETQKIYGPTTTEDGRTETVTFAYDVDGNRSAFGSNALALGYLYNNRQQLSTIQYNNDNWTLFEYNAAGQRTARIQANYTGSDYGYDGAGRLDNLRSYRRTDGSGILQQRFGYDLRDRRTWVTRDDQYGDTWRYQEDSQLIEQRTNVWRPDQYFWNAASFTDGFAYDPSGNRTSWNENGAVTSYNTDALNQYTTITGLAIQHGDGRGNVTQLGGWSFTYNADNRMTRAVGPGHDLWPHYDAMGRLSKIVDHDSSGQHFEYRFYDGSQQFWRMTGGGSLLDMTIWGPTPDEVISRYVPGSDWWHNWQFYHQDPLNSVVAITNIDRVVLERYLYDAFGAADIRDGSWNARSASAIGNRWQFTGQEWFAELGLHNYKARFYCNRIGRFLQNDPIRFDAGDLNLYRYCGNAPTIFIDPTGTNFALLLGTRLMMTGAVTTQLDSPAPGPADVVGIGIAATGALIYAGGSIYEWATSSDASSLDEEFEETDRDRRVREQNEEHPLKERERKRKERRGRPDDREEKEARKKELEDIKKGRGEGGDGDGTIPDEEREIPMPEPKPKEPKAPTSAQPSSIIS